MSVLYYQEGGAVEGVWEISSGKEIPSPDILNSEKGFFHFSQIVLADFLDTLVGGEFSWKTNFPKRIPEGGSRGKLSLRAEVDDSVFSTLQRKLL